MRVLMTTDTVGGVWTFTQELASGLLEHGCQVALVSLGGEPSEDQRGWCLRMAEGWGRSFSFCSVDDPLEWMQENALAFTDAAPLLMKLVEDFKPDVVHCNQFCFGALPTCIPKMVTAHSDVRSWAACCCEVPLERSTWLEQYDSLACAGLAGADAVVAPTQWMMQALGRNFRLPEKQFVIPNGRKVDTVPQSRRKLQAVTAGRLWDEAKGIATLSEVRCLIPLLVAGETSCEQESAAAVSVNIEFVGALSQEALLTLFQESAIYVCTSHYEPFGLAPLEAALCGCAVLANDIASLREVWGDGAMYFSGADALSQLLDALSNDQELLANAQAQSYKRAQRYSREAMVGTYLSLFEEVASRKRALAHVA